MRLWIIAFEEKLWAGWKPTPLYSSPKLFFRNITSTARR